MERDLGREPHPIGEKNIAYTDSQGYRARGVVSLDSEGAQTGTRTNPLFVRDYLFEVGEYNIPNKNFIHKFGRNVELSTPVGTFETVWNGGGLYTGFNAVVAETLEVFSDNVTDVGALVSSGIATGGSTTTLIDDGATFISDGVVVGDAILNDTDISHGMITEVTSETILTVFKFDKSGIFASSTDIGDAYRIATTASTGASVVELELMLDGNFSNETEEFIILNGTTAVDTVGEYIRQSRATVIQAGSGGVNAGEITSRQKTATANIMMVMPAELNKSMICAYTIPAGREGHLMSMYATLAGKTQANCNVRFMTRHIGEVFQVEEEFSISGAGSSYVLREYRVPKNEMPAATDIEIRMDTDAVNTAVASGFDLITSEI
jgi:hypothetical protein